MYKPKFGISKGTRTPVAAVKGRSPRPLDDGDLAVGERGYRQCFGGWQE
jgi:hypothetical protein